MRKYGVFILLLIINMQYAISGSSEAGVMHNDQEEISFDDSIRNIIDNRRCLIYSTGHHGFIWSMFARVDNMPLILSGCTRDHSFNIDTLKYENPILTWGLGTLDNEYKFLEPQYRKEYWPIYEQLILYSDSGSRLFELNNAVSYSGKDSIRFNKKLNKLKYFLYWYAGSKEVQELLPKPE